MRAAEVLSCALPSPSRFSSGFSCSPEWKDRDLSYICSLSPVLILCGILTGTAEIQGNENKHSGERAFIFLTAHSILCISLLQHIPVRGNSFYVNKLVLRRRMSLLLNHVSGKDEPSWSNLYIKNWEMLDKQLAQNEIMQQVTQLLVMDVNWLGILKILITKKSRLLGCCTYWNYTTRTLLKLSFWSLGKSWQNRGARLPKEWYYHSQEWLAFPRAPGFFPWKLPGWDPRAERRRFSDINCSTTGSGGKSESCRTLIILKSLFILAFQI